MKILRPLPVALAVGSFLAISFFLCVLYGLIVPTYWQMYPAWERFLPGFKWLSLASVCIGLIETFVYGFYVGYVFVPLYNLFGKANEPEPKERR